MSAVVELNRNLFTSPLSSQLQFYRSHPPTLPMLIHSSHPPSSDRPQTCPTTRQWDRKNPCFIPRISRTKSAFEFQSLLWTILLPLLVFFAPWPFVAHESICWSSDVDVGDVPAGQRQKCLSPVDERGQNLILFCRVTLWGQFKWHVGVEEAPPP